MAAFNPAVAEAALAAGFVPRTQRTIRTKEQFLRCLAETRERGYAFSVEEDEPGLASVAAPVLDHTGIARAAISVAGPVARVSGEPRERDGSTRAGGRPPADEHRVGLVGRLGLSLRCSVRQNVVP